MRKWLDAPPQFRSSYAKGQVAAMEGRPKKDCPYEDLVGHPSQRHARAWLAGFDSVEKARAKA